MGEGERLGGKEGALDTREVGGEVGGVGGKRGEGRGRGREIAEMVGGKTKGGIPVQADHRWRGEG